ncbi:tumor protein p53-inducible nuclear protein 1 [Latimeria chalumnae]|uniref:Si:ch211-260e23.9 n=1 Tax=Latimeria chalumnae TaxID=7897 RepID=H2ZRM1_LATCH|nr:PREDICTED: tumor protein p53-inducible nuclear protein 1-like [Latimeria chalumnae]|eukprot:XP_005997069.1 PREDICTED: tumor protein p53-inducible nuclear protein 1-like [Latimeria chalumnae]
MIGKLTTLFLGDNSEKDKETSNDLLQDLYECEEGDWIIVNVHERHPVAQLGISPFENLLIEHPSMSVYNPQSNSSEDEKEAEMEKEESSRASWILHYMPRRVILWDGVLKNTSHFHYMQLARRHVERRKLSCNQLNRQNRSRKCCPSKVKRFGNMKQPTKRVYNY